MERGDFVGNNVGCGKERVAPKQAAFESGCIEFALAVFGGPIGLVIPDDDVFLEIVIGFWIGEDFNLALFESAGAVGVAGEGCFIEAIVPEGIGFAGLF